MKHEIKIKQNYLCRILTGEKTFEVRKNDRDYQVGDTIIFLPLLDDEYDAYEVRSPIPKYEITYVLPNFEGVNSEYVVFSIREVKENKTNFDLIELR